MKSFVEYDAGKKQITQKLTEVKNAGSNGTCIFYALLR